PSASPTLHLARRKTDGLGSVLVSQAWLLMQKEHEAITLGNLNRDGASSNRVTCILHEIVWEGTTSGHGTWHSGFLSLPGSFGIHPLVPKVYPNHDVICETDHLGTANLSGNSLLKLQNSALTTLPVRGAMGQGTFWSGLGRPLRSVLAFVA